MDKQKHHTTEQAIAADTRAKQPELEAPQKRSGILLSPKVSSLRRKLGYKAEQEPKFRFYALYDRIYRLDVLRSACHLVTSNNGAPGVDGVSCQDIRSSEDGVDLYLQELHDELRDKRYRPQPVKRVYISKPDGSKRPLGIPTVKDRIVQTATLLILEPIFEADFTDCSFGFRPGRSAHQALDKIADYIKQGYEEIYDADLKGYFDTIPHDHLIKCLEKRISDRSVLSLIRNWLKSPVVEDDEDGGKRVSRPKQGTPQGGVISPLLANIYLHWFEHVFYLPNSPGTWAKAKLVRYADDFVILARYQGRQMINWVETVLEGRFRLTINRAKTSIVNLNTAGASLDFLGYTFRYDRDLYGGSHSYLNVVPSDKACKSVCDNVREKTTPKRCFMPIDNMIGDINKTLVGWGNYFSYGYPSKAHSRVNKFVQNRLITHLKRRSQRAFRPPEGKSFYAQLKSYGLERLRNTKR